MSEKSSAKKLTAGIAVLIVLSLCLCITTVALVMSTLRVENNLFHTGLVDINLNDARPVIEENEFLFEPGATVKKDFFIENNSTCDVYYKLYLSNVDGGLADVLQIIICDGDRTLYQGTASQLTRKKVLAADDELKIGEKKILTIYFRFPESAGNEAQNQILTFDLCAEAVQTKNNPNRLFD